MISDFRCQLQFKLISLIMFITPLAAQTARNYSNEFMNIGVDAAGLSMSGAVVASTDDINSGYWNPAGLVNLDDSTIALITVNNSSPNKD